MKELEVMVKKWEERKITGNYKCPNCKEQLIIIPINLFGDCLAYCIYCEKVFESKRED